MGHQHDDTMQFYVSGFVGIDSQAIVHGLEQRAELYKEASSIMANRNLLAPKPPGATLIEPTTYTMCAPMESDEELVEIVQQVPLTTKQQHELRRQMRGSAYRKKRRDFLNDQDVGVQDSRRAEILESGPSRTPSRYLLALMKFEPERKTVVDLWFGDNDIEDTDRIELPWEAILQPLIKMASPLRKRYTYQSATPTKRNCCSVCSKDLTK
jgi:hypothetical protein